jgi:phage tail P2-like protein
MSKSHLPSNFRNELMLSLEEVLLEFMEIAGIESFKIRDFWNPLKCPEELLPILAKYLGASGWDSSWGLQQKRTVCLNALSVNRKLGTVNALKRALKDLKLNATIKEWWQDSNLTKGEAELELQENEIIYSQEQYNRIYKFIDEVKRLGLHLKITKRFNLKGNIFTGGALIQTNRTTLGE